MNQMCKPSPFFLISRNIIHIKYKSLIFIRILRNSIIWIKSSLKSISCSRKAKWGHRSSSIEFKGKPPKRNKAVNHQSTEFTNASSANLQNTSKKAWLTFASSNKLIFIRLSGPGNSWPSPLVARTIWFTSSAFPRPKTTWAVRCAEAQSTHLYQSQWINIWASKAVRKKPYRNYSSGYTSPLLTSNCWVCVTTKNFS